MSQSCSPLWLLSGFLNQSTDTFSVRVNGFRSKVLLLIDLGVLTIIEKLLCHLGIDIFLETFSFLRDVILLLVGNDLFWVTFDYRWSLNLTSASLREHLCLGLVPLHEILIWVVDWLFINTWWSGLLWWHLQWWATWIPFESLDKVLCWDSIARMSSLHGFFHEVGIEILNALFSIDHSSLQHLFYLFVVNLIIVSS